MKHSPNNHIKSMAKSATLHCLTGCAIGEITGLVVGTALGLNNAHTIILAIALAFVFGYSLSALPLIKSGMTFSTALSLVFAADTLSILSMEIVENLVMTIVPGAMNSGLVNPLYWLTMSIALVAGFFAAYPVNLHLLKKGKGHALVHKHMGHGGHHA